jgi:hypothetical protein
MPLAQPVVGVKSVDCSVNVGGTMTSSNGKCMACSYDEHFGLGLSGAMSPVEGEDSKRSPSGVSAVNAGKRMHLFQVLRPA